MSPPRLILASASPRRLQLLQQVGIAPHKVIAANIDESPLKLELPNDYAVRIASQKARAVAMSHADAVVLAADTVVACGRSIFPKAEDANVARKCLEKLSGRRHRVYTAVCVEYAGKIKQKLVMTQVQFKRLSPKEIDAYIATGEWQGKAGGYAIQGLAEAFILSLYGSYSNVVGLPLSQTVQMLSQFGIVRES